MKNWLVAGFTLMCGALFAAPSVTEVTARQRYPWNGMVDISCTAGGVVTGKNRTTVTATDLAAGTNVTVATLSVAGAAVENGAFSLAAGANQILWDAQKDLPKDYLSERMKIDVAVVPYSFSVKFNANGGTGTMANESFDYGTAKALTANAFTRSGYTFSGWATTASGAVAYTDKQSVSNLSATDKATVNLYAVWKQTNPLYMVIDLSAGANATSYPVTYLDTEPSGGFNVDAYKTTKLVLKRIEPGSFIMGENQSDQSHKVTLTKPFYMGLFEVTQKQWRQVMGSNPSRDYGVGETYPVYYVSYNMIRGSSEGAKWPSSGKVDSSSFLGKLQAKTGINFDLPTEAQWEYSCRAGTTTAYYWGSSMSGEYARYSAYSGPLPVGLHKPNIWGLYDMSGNVWELNLDWYGTLVYGFDPKGSASGSNRVLRGGCWSVDGSYCTSFYRNGGFGPSSTGSYIGLRLSRTP